MKIKAIGLILGILFLLTACEQDEFLVKPGTPPGEIFTLANKQLAKGKGVKAGDYLLEVERLYPFTPEAERALILAAQVYHDHGALLESRAAASRYLQYFPGSKNAALAQYLVALSYYDGITDIQRDQSRTFEALKAFETVIGEYPNTEYAELSRDKFTVALNQLAGKEMDVGRYYLRNKDYAAAIGRFRAVLDEYPDNLHKPEAHHRIIESYLGLGLRGEALATFTKMKSAYPDSQWTARSNTLLATGRQPNAGASELRKVFTGSAL